MKRIVTILFSSIFLYGCIADTPATICLNAYSPEELGHTKTVAEENGQTYSVIWTENDKIIVNGNESLSINVDKANPKKAAFSFEWTERPYRSLYPSSAYRSGSVISIPEQQKYVQGSFDPEAAIMLGYSNFDDRIDFHHAVAYLNIKVTTPNNLPIASITVSGNADERMSGQFTASYEDASLSCDEKDGSVVTVSNGVESIPSSFGAMVAIPARTYSDGISLRIVYGDNMIKTLKSSKTFPAVKGRVYETSVVIEDNIVEIEGLGKESLDMVFEESLITSCVNADNLTLTPFVKLNQSEGEINSHSECHSRSSLKMMYETFQRHDASQGYCYPRYARLRKLSNGTYIQIWQTPSDKDVNSGSSNGKDIYYSLSTDFMNWSEPMSLFSSKYVYYDILNRDTRHYSNGNGIVLSNGDFLAVAAFRAPEIYNDQSYKNYQGLVIKRSRDNGYSWTQEQIIYYGPCWEPHLMEVAEGVIHCYFAESRPWIGGSHSGTSLVISNDGGATWTPAVGNEPYRVMRKKWYSAKDDDYFFTDQMAVGIKLNNSSQMAFAVECVDSRDISNNQTYSSSIVYSPVDGQWEYLEGDEEASCERLDKVGDGGAPYLVQFRSGETVMTYSNSIDNKMYYRIGDSHAAEFKESCLALPDKGSWGGMEVESPHTVLMCRSSSKDNVSSLIKARFALNHNIVATSRESHADGDNSEWKNTDEALYLGATSESWATLRCSQHSDKVYFLIEVADENLTSEDYVTLTLAYENNTNTIPYGARRIKVTPKGEVTAERYSSEWENAEMGAVVTVAYDGVVDADGIDRGYIIEMEISRSSLEIHNGRILVNFSMYDSNVALEDAVASSSENTSTWIEVNGL